MADDRLTLVQKFFQAYFDGRIDDAVAMLEPDVQIHLPGRARIAGDFVGPDAVAAHLKQFLEMTEDPVNVLGYDDWLVGTVYIAGVVRLELQRPGRLDQVRIVYLVRVSESLKISRVNVFYDNPDVFERFFDV
jgi:ketosteroid isomerase-like protein